MKYAGHRESGQSGVNPTELEGTSVTATCNANNGSKCNTTLQVTPIPIKANNFGKHLTVNKNPVVKDSNKTEQLSASWTYANGMGNQQGRDLKQSKQNSHGAKRSHSCENVCSIKTQSADGLPCKETDRSVSMVLSSNNNDLCEVDV